MIKDKKLFMKIKLPNAKIPFNELSPSERNKQVKLIGDYYVTLRIYIVDKNKHKNINSVKRVYFKDSMSKNKYRSEIICRNHEIIFTTATFPEYSDNEKVSTITNFNGSKVNIENH